MKSESQYQKFLGDKLRSAGAMVLKLHGHAQQSSGWPDLFIGHRIWTGWLEVKFQDGRWKNELQRHRIRDLRFRNVPCFVIRWMAGHEVLEDEDGNIVGKLEGDGAERLKLLKHYWEVDREKKNE